MKQTGSISGRWIWLLASLHLLLALLFLTPINLPGLIGGSVIVALLVIPPIVVIMLVFTWDRASVKSDPVFFWKSVVILLAVCILEYFVFQYALFAKGTIG
ncbi:hypothetical protein BH11ARM2_BH11ARM2_35860 [soil metagenome]